MVPRLIFLLFSFLAACGPLENAFQRKSDQETRVEFHLQSSASHGTMVAQDLYGSLMIYLWGVDGNPNAASLNLDNKYQSGGLSLPNGPYRAYAVGWGGDNSGPCNSPSPCEPVRGQTFCSDPNGVPINLIGGTVPMTLVMSSANCTYGSPSVFSPGQAAPGLSEFKPLQIYICGSGSTLPGTCGVSVPRDVKMEAVVYRRNMSDPIIDESKTKEFGCAPNADETTPASTSKNFMPGNSSHPIRPFVYRFRVYNGGSGCTGAMLGEFLFKGGLDTANSYGPSVASFDYYNGGASHSLLKLANPAF